jgi:hypothetical protein
VVVAVNVIALLLLLRLTLVMVSVPPFVPMLYWLEPEDAVHVVGKVPLAVFTTDKEMPADEIGTRTLLALTVPTTGEGCVVTVRVTGTVTVFSPLGDVGVNVTVPV